MAIQDDNLRDFLARRYSRRPAVISFIETPAIKLNEAELPNEGSTQDLWHAVLRLTKQMDTIQQLIAEVRRQYEKDAELIDKLAEAWLKGKDAAPVDINLANPYPGLRPFEEADRAQFFGRERWIKALSTSLDQHGFVTLYGGSGSGKSSLVRAGLMPRLKKEGHAVVLFTPGKNPFDSLLAMGLGNKAQAQKLIDTAQMGQLPGLFAELAAKCFPGQPLLIIMDQGEELYTRCENAELRERFLQCLFHDRGPSTRVLIGIREDFFDRWNKTRAHDPDFGATNLSLTAPDEDDWRAIIVEPARQHGVMFEAELPDRMIERLRNARSGLPLLQFLLQKLWEHDNPADGVLNQDSYDSLGGVDHALRGHVESFIARYPGRESEIRQMLFKLVRFTRQDGQYRALSRSCPVKDLPKDLADALVGDEWRLLTTRGQAGEVELSHEVILRVWPGFEKLEQERGALHALKSDITDATARWQPQKQKTELWAGSRLEESLKRSGLPGLVDDAKTSDDFASAETPLSDTEREFLQTSRTKVIADRQFQRRLLIGVTVTAVVMLLIAAGAALFWKEAEEQKVIANEQKTKAQREETRAKQLTVKAASALGSDSALEVMRTLTQNPDIVQEWEGRFLAKRVGFAPMKLQRNEIGILDQGPLKGSGLYQAAVGLYADKGAFDAERLFKSQGITFEVMGTTLEVRQDAGNIPLLTLNAYKYGRFNNLWLAPDSSCFLVRANRLRVKSFELTQLDQPDDAGESDEIYLFPLLEKYSCETLVKPQKAETAPANGETPDTPKFDYMTLLAGGQRHLFAHDYSGMDMNSFSVRFEDAVSGGRPTVEIAPPVGEEKPLALMLRQAVPKDKLAAWDKWIAQGVRILCADWSKDEIEVGAFQDGYFLLGPVTAPEKMKKLKLPVSAATSLWNNDPMSSLRLILSYSTDGRQLLAYPWQNLQVAVINRDTMTVERVISGRDDHMFEYVDFRSWVQLGSSSTGSIVWATTQFKTEGETYVFRNGSGKPEWEAGSSIFAVDMDASERVFAQSLRISNQIRLRDGFSGPILASVSANVFDLTDLIRESPQVPGRMLLGDTLLRTEGHTEIMPLPKGIVLAPDWSWAAYLEKGSEVEADYHFDAPYLRIIQGLNGPATDQARLADKARDFQFQWFSSPNMQQQFQNCLSQSFEAREAGLSRRFAWPHSLLELTLEQYETLRKQAPESLAAAKALLEERPGSPTARFIKAAAAFLATENVADAVREIEARIDKSEETWSMQEPNQAWGELASYVIAKGGRLPEKLSLEANTYWLIVRSLRAGNASAMEWFSYFNADDKSNLLAQLLALSHIAHTADDKEAAHQGLASIRLLMTPPAWFTASVQSRKLVRDPVSMLLWTSLCPEAFMTSLDEMFQTLPADQDIVQSCLKLAQTLYARENRDLAERYTRLIQPFPGLELEAASLLIRHGVQIEGASIQVPEDAPASTRLAWLGRLALTRRDTSRQNADAAKFAELRAGRTLQQLTDDELRSYFCILLATLSYEDPAIRKWDEARSVLKLMQTRQPALNDPEKLKFTSWTNEEERAIDLLLQGPPKN